MNQTKINNLENKSNNNTDNNTNNNLENKSNNNTDNNTNNNLIFNFDINKFFNNILPNNNVLLDDNTSILSLKDETKKCLSDMIYLLTHIIFTIVLIICLKRTSPITLAIILSLILGYISYNERNIIPIYMLFICGSLIYVLNLFAMDNYFFYDNNLLSNNHKPKIKTFILNIWKIPYYGIISYYVMLCAIFCLKN